ncbi:hypothetical protein EDD30_0908 [Couchioplanes caeruleus]|uniref:Uncharacterized protein n=2 Tax=Couchioplanes caeruleus TaxID=56438 RepID=A0A1K0FDW5_9ACTN|nr:hypothetical protein BG844_29320 [Couchioplanes caeruleus subsp. caeruleus]ROP28191.1 hypothetical protein EDD30_0908 [Couchioplanes caeruleus]
MMPARLILDEQPGPENLVEPVKDLGDREIPAGEARAGPVDPSLKALFGKLGKIVVSPFLKNHRGDA